MRAKYIKVVEIRDRGTFIPAFAILMQPSKTEKYLFDRCGHRGHNVMLISIAIPEYSARGSVYWDARSPRSMKVAHKWIEENFHTIENCQVVDVEFILGEKDKPSLPEWKELVIK